jgi:hypothetical protein
LFNSPPIRDKVNSKTSKKNMLEQIQQAVGHAWDLLFSAGTGDTHVNAGVVPRFLGFLQAHPILLLPLGFFLIFLGIKTVRKLITGY